MQDILELAKTLGHAIQADERYLKVRAAQEDADKDEALQELIGQFNLKRIAMNAETAKGEAEKDSEKYRQLDSEMREIYAKIMENPNMKAYQVAKTDLDLLTRSVMTIVNMSIQGMDPDTYEENSGCSGDCSACGGCH